MTPEQRLYGPGTRSINATEITRFKAAGVPLVALGLPDLITPASVIFDRDRFLFEDEMVGVVETTPTRSAAFLIVCRDESGEIIDLAAWRPSDGALATWLGVAWAIGEDWLAEPYSVLRPDTALSVFATSMAWLRAGRRGLVIVDSARAAWGLRHHMPVLAEDFTHASALETALTIKPHILIPEIADRIAA